MTSGATSACTARTHRPASRPTTNVEAGISGTPVECPLCELTFRLESPAPTGIVPRLLAPSLENPRLLPNPLTASLETDKPQRNLHFSLANVEMQRRLTRIAGVLRKLHRVSACTVNLHCRLSVRLHPRGSGRTTAGRVEECLGRLRPADVRPQPTHVPAHVGHERHDLDSVHAPSRPACQPTRPTRWLQEGLLHRWVTVWVSCR